MSSTSSAAADSSVISNLNASKAAAVHTPSAPGTDGLPVATPFDLTGRTVLVTGGGSGIGLYLVAEFIKYGARTIIITGRREDVLKQAQAKFSKADVRYIVSDAGKVSDRISLFAQVEKSFPELTVLVNNAGVQRRVPLSEDTNSDWSESQAEIDINFAAPIHLSNLFAPLLLKQKNGAAIIHITSGLAWVPYVRAPVYSATKAALHSFIISQRISFEGTAVRVVEISPPAVKSNLGGTHDFGEEPTDFVESVFPRWTKGELEVGFKHAEEWRTKSRVELIQQAERFAEVAKLPRYQNAF